MIMIGERKKKKINRFDLFFLSPNIVLITRSSGMKKDWGGKTIVID
jgi:hypothetical protein